MENNQKKKRFNLFDFIYYKGERLSRKGWRIGGELLFVFLWITICFAAGNIPGLQFLRTNYALFGGSALLFLLCYLFYYRPDNYDELHERYGFYDIPEELVLIVISAIMAITVYVNVS